MFGDDTDYRRRLLVAFAIAIALHEIVAAFVHWSRPSAEKPEQISVLHIVRIERRPTPKPTPHLIPTPKPIATPRVVVKVNPAPAAPKAATHTRGAAKSIAHTVHHAPRIEHIALPKIAHAGPGLTHSGSGVGAGGTSRGTGTGSGGQGTGTGAGGRGTGQYAAPNEPCGYVEFIPHAEPEYDKSTGAFRETIRMMVHYPDGHVDATNLDWKWYYPNEAADPWSAQNLKNQNFRTLFQAPPPDKAASEPAIVQYVIQHSSADGYTLLKECPPAPR